MWGNLVRGRRGGDDRQSPAVVWEPGTMELVELVEPESAVVAWD